MASADIPSKTRPIQSKGKYRDIELIMQEIKERVENRRRDLWVPHLSTRIPANRENTTLG